MIISHLFFLLFKFFSGQLRMQLSYFYFVNFIFWRVHKNRESTFVFRFLAISNLHSCVTMFQLHFRFLFHRDGKNS